MKDRINFTGILKNFAGKERFFSARLPTRVKLFSIISNIDQKPASINKKTLVVFIFNPLIQTSEEMI